MRTGFGEITAVILAGGKGERLKAVLQGRPKVLAEVAGKPFLAHRLEELQLSGLLRVVLAAGVGADQIREAFGNWYQNLELIYSREEKPLGTGGALRLALDVCEGETFLVMNGDSFCDVNLNDFLAWFQKGNYEIGMVLAPSSGEKRFGVVSVNPEGRILAFQEKEKSSRQDFVNAGIYLFKRCAVEMIPKNREVSLEREIFPAWISRAFYGYPTGSILRDIGTPESYAECRSFFEKRKGTVPLFIKKSEEALSPCL